MLPHEEFVSSIDPGVWHNGQSDEQQLRALVEGSWAMGLPLIIILGLKFGIFTPTEAAVVAAVYSLFVSLVIYRELKVSQLYEVILSSAKTTSVVMLLVAAAMVSSWLVTIADLPGQLAAVLEPFMSNPTLLLLVIMLLIIMVGTVMDMTPTILILTPVLMPAITQVRTRQQQSSKPHMTRPLCVKTRRLPST